MEGKLVIVGYSPLTIRTEVILGLRKLACDVAVEYWDVSPIVENQGFPISCEITGVKVQIINNLDQFIHSSTALEENTFVIFNMMVKYDTYVFYKYLAETKCKMATIVSGSLPIFNSEANPSTKYRIIHLFRKIKQHFNNKAISVHYRNRIVSKKLKTMRPFDYYFYAGSKANFSSYNYNEKTIRIPINGYDYQIGKNIKDVKGKYILFIDEYIPYHPDFSMLGINPITPEVYFKEHNDLFDRIEERYGLPVVIAAHPRAEKYKEHNYYNGRKVLFGKTADLASYAEFVITYYSTAVSFAIMRMRPVLFVYTNDLKTKDPDYFIAISMAESLNSNIVNISESNDTDVYPVDIKRYEDYLFSYETSVSSQNKDNSDIILDIIKKSITMNR